MRAIKTFLNALLFITFCCHTSQAQIDQGGVPPSFKLLSLTREVNTIILPRPDDMPAEEMISDKDMVPPMLGPVIPVNIDLPDEGTWTDLPGGTRICRLKVKSEGALAMAFYYNSFRIPGQGRLYIYNENRSFLIGAFTAANNPKNLKFATELIPGDVIYLEYHDTGAGEKPEIVISGVLYASQHVSFISDQGRGYGNSGSCEVNINCPEGVNYQKEKRGVARILLKANGSAFWCSGSLVNNVRQDSTPYFLTAAHCGQNATSADYEQWIFYFNYESPTCEDPLENPQFQSMTGSMLIAQAPDATSTGSDFKLLMLNSKVPFEYNPYFNGWNRENVPSDIGVCIHHPKGDIKKISTYTETLISTAYSSNNEDPEEKYWRVIWSATQTNHGVTEGGSSGSPLFNQNGKIIGALSGGFASCTNLDLPDFFGKFSYSWNSNNTSAERQLAPWLDPDLTGMMQIEGFGYGNLLLAGFFADTTAVILGDHVQFYDNSIGDPGAWFWDFPGGKPSQAEGKNPGRILYDSYGNYTVKLIVYKEGLSDTLVRENYINVGASIYPVPASEQLTINFGNTEVTQLELELYNTSGEKVKEIKMVDGKARVFKWNISDVPAGMYLLRYKVDGRENPVQKIIIS